MCFSSTLVEEAVPESEGKFLRFSGLKNPFSLPGISIFSGLYFKSAMLAVLLLTIGISLSKNDFIYAEIKQHYPQKNLLANADMGFAHGLSDTAITFLSKELVYERAGAN